MRCRFPAVGVLMAVMAIATLAAVPAAGQALPDAAKAPDATKAMTQATKPGSSTAQPKTLPRTPWGDPDLQGIWLSNSAAPLERPKALEGRQFLTDEEVTELKKRAARLFDPSGTSDFGAGDSVFLAALTNPEVYKSANHTTGGALEMIEREFDNRTSLIVDPPDGRVPPLTPDAQQKQAAVQAAGRPPPAGPEDLSNALRCITFGVPRLGGNFGVGIYGYYQIVQAPGVVVLITEEIHDARIIPLDGRPHLPQNVRQWNGDSRGRWEGRTLVVDTTNFSAKSNFMGSAENLHLVERFTRVAPDTINYEIALSDSTTWTKSWSAVIRLRQTQDKIYEYACHEGNYDVMHGMLAWARAEEKAADEAAKNGK
jgi:hypothetical protein